MTIAAFILAGLAALLHVYIWYLESYAWTGRARAVFGTSEADARATREMAFNQGYYNLFLAVITATGITVAASGARTVGFALILAGTGAMAGAALVLGLSSPDKRAAAVKQGTIPLLAVVATVIAWVVG